MSVFFCVSYLVKKVVKALYAIYTCLLYTSIFDENAMWLAVFGDVGVCLLAVANALRVLHIRKKKK